MKDFARRKQYVEVVATHYIDGSVRPQKSSWQPGRSTRLRTAGRRRQERPTPQGNWPGAIL